MEKLKKLLVSKVEPLLLKEFTFTGWQIVLFGIVLAIMKIVFF